jgi:hypothetical protein
MRSDARSTTAPVNAPREWPKSSLVGQLVTERCAIERR